MKDEKPESALPIKPLFLPIDGSENMGKDLIQLASDDYNKALGNTLINAKDDAQAISIFLSEYKDSPETLRSYAKEIERLLLWCIHVAKIIPNPFLLLLILWVYLLRELRSKVVYGDIS